ncbi:NYN domain-containing protein [Phycicoccus flavus]|uniref:NYN domain-containing protein n=1 Tax=Phycicoccus flavus TaxID=2502783 RepID=A0A8T6QZS4_9MICO|nr:NYN domain-containing protein [Phycicoccus flavus]NHA66764.1 NYN domain-containing protein [Phycicoccus flavus]
MSDADRVTYVLVDGENIDATLGGAILARRPRPEERPRWERVLRFVEETWDQPARGLFFLASSGELPMAFVQALVAIGFRPVPLSGAPGQKVVDIGIQRTLAALRDRDADVVLVSNDGDFVEELEPLVGDRRTGIVGFDEFRNHNFAPLVARGLETFDLEHDVAAFNEPLPRLRVIPIDEFDPVAFL